MKDYTIEKEDNLKNSKITPKQIKHYYNKVLNEFLQNDSYSNSTANKDLDFKDRNIGSNFTSIKKNSRDNIIDGDINYFQITKNETSKFNSNKWKLLKSDLIKYKQNSLPMKINNIIKSNKKKASLIQKFKTFYPTVSQRKNLLKRSKMSKLLSINRENSLENNFKKNKSLEEINEHTKQKNSHESDYIYQKLYYRKVIFSIDLRNLPTLHKGESVGILGSEKSFQNFIIIEKTNIIIERISELNFLLKNGSLIRIFFQ